MSWDCDTLYSRYKDLFEHIYKYDSHIRLECSLFNNCFILKFPWPKHYGLRIIRVCTTWIYFCTKVLVKENVTFSYKTNLYWSFKLIYYNMVKVLYKMAKGTTLKRYLRLYFEFGTEDLQMLVLKSYLKPCKHYSFFVFLFKYLRGIWSITLCQIYFSLKHFPWLKKFPMPGFT